MTQLARPPLLGWEFVLADAITGTVIAPLRAYDKKLSVGINMIDTFSFRTRLDDRYADSLLDVDKVIVKGYQYEGGASPVIRFCGPIVSVQEASDASGGASLACVAQGGPWRLTKRLVAKTPYGWTLGTAGSPVDRSTLVSNMIQYVNGKDSYVTFGSAAENASHSGIDVGTTTASSTGYIGPYYYKTAWETMLEIALTLGGPDLVWRPREPTIVSSVLRLGYVDIFGSAGQDRPEVIFDYGCGRFNVASYNRNLDSSGIANRVYSVGPPGDQTTTVQSAQDTVAQAARGLYEDRVESDLTVDSMRQALCGAHVAVRAYPRHQVTFIPTRNRDKTGFEQAKFTSALWRDFNLGDTVRLRAEVKGRTRLNVSLRVYAAQFDINEDGAVRPAYTVVPA